VAKEKKEAQTASLNTTLDGMGTFTVKEDFISTGIDLLDSYFAGSDIIKKGGGVPRRKWTSIAGESTVGKSTLFMHCISNMVKNGYKVLYQDIENGLTENILNNFGVMEYTAKIAEEFISGSKNFYSYSPFTYFESLSTLRQLLSKTKIDVVVIDSFKQLIQDGEYENDEVIKDGGTLLKSTQTDSDFYPALRCLAKFNNFAGLGIQQIRLKKAGMIFYEDETGSNAYKHNLDQRFYIKARNKITKMTINNLGEKFEKHIGNWIEIIPRKSRFGNRVLKIPLIFGRGISMIQLFKDILENEGYISCPKGSRNTYIKVPGLFDENNPNWDSLKQSCSFKNDEFINQIRDNFDFINNFVIENKLLYLEKESD